VSCDFFGVWGTYPTCQKSACAPYQVENGVEVATGVTGDSVRVSCAQGYTGPLEFENNQTGGYVDCQASGTFTSFLCTPNQCENLVVPLSRDYGIHTSGVSGYTGDTVTVECMEPFASGTFQTTCQTDGTFSSVECTGIPLCAVEVRDGQSTEGDDIIEQSVGGAEWRAVGNCTANSIFGGDLCGTVVYSTGEPDVKTCYTPSCTCTGDVVCGIASDCMNTQCVIYDCPATSPSPSPSPSPEAITTSTPSTPVTDTPPTPVTTSTPVTSAPSTPVTTSTPVTETPLTPVTTSTPVTSDPSTPVTSAPSTPTTDSSNPDQDTVEAFVATIKLSNMNDGYVESNVDGVLTAIKDGSCNALSGSDIDPSPSCTSLNLVLSSDRRGRRSLAAGEWTATVSITSSAMSHRASSIAYFNDDSNDLNDYLTTALEDSGHRDAIADGSTLESDTSASGTSTNDDDDDGESFPMLIVAIAAGVVGVIVLAAVLFMCRRSKARELTITTSSSGPRAAVGQGFQQEPLHMFEGPGPDDL